MFLLMRKTDILKMKGYFFFLLIKMAQFKGVLIALVSLAHWLEP